MTEQEIVSTHSRPKAAGSQNNKNDRESRSFNTQPPEGGWRKIAKAAASDDVSTHSRPKAAGKERTAEARRRQVSTHSRPKAAGSQPCEYS